MVGSAALIAQYLPNYTREAILSLIKSSTTLCTASNSSIDVFFGKLNNVPVIEGSYYRPVCVVLNRSVTQMFGRVNTIGPCLYIMVVHDIQAQGIFHIAHVP